MLFRLKKLSANKMCVFFLTREELVKCQESIQSLEREIEKIEKEIELQESQENK